MTIETFYATLKFMIELDRELSLQGELESISSSLGNLVNAPAQPQYQSALATGLSNLSNGMDALGRNLTPSLVLSIVEMGGGEYFDPHIADNVRLAVSENAMTPSVARDSIQRLVSKRASFLKTVEETEEGLEKLGIRESTLSPGSADLSFLIPRELFKNQLGSFAKELTFLSRLVGDFSEALTGTAEPAQLEQLASSIPTVAIMTGVKIVAAIAEVVNKFVEAWGKIEKIRKIRGELSEMGLKGAATEQLTTQITTTVDELIEESIRFTLNAYSGEATRKKELENAIRQDTRRLFGQIERGLTIQFRAAPAAKNMDPEDKKALDDVTRISQTIQFPGISIEPLLLTPGEVIEGELV